MEKFIVETENSIRTQEQSHEGLEARVRVIEVPLEDQSTRFEKVENQIAALSLRNQSMWSFLQVS